MSSVSGGSYVSAWMLAHLGSNQAASCADLFDKKDLEGCGYDEYGYMVRTEKLEDVLNNDKDFVRHLRAHRSFIKEEGWWDGLSLAGAYLARLPFYYLFDLGLHIKDFHDIGNEVHITNLYKDRIEQTFQRGKKETTLADVNKDANEEDLKKSQYRSPPYLIVNGNLVNRGESQGSGKSGRLHRDNFNFEFTRHYTGSDGLGYVETPGFGLPVKRVERDDEGRPTKVVVQAPSAHPSFRFSYAVEASGAAVDIDSVVNEFIHEVTIRNALQILLLPFNMNFEYQTWNFARGAGEEFPEALFDYLRMMTYQRIPNFVRTDARWIEITDGSFFDNLGVLSLLRRGVRHVAVGDSTWDPKWKYNYLKFLKKETEEFQIKWCTPLPDPGDIVWQKDFWVQRPDGLFAVIHYIKPYACNPDLTGMPCDEDLHVPMTVPGEPNRKPTPSLNPGPKLNGVPAHLAKIQGKVNKDHNLMVTKVAKFAVSEDADDFPQTSTAIQAFGWEQFEAYRLLGYLMGKTYLANINFDQEPVFPGTCV